MQESQNSYNKIDEAESAYLYISLSQLPASGNGLHTAINIYKDEYIAMFKGEILTNLQARLRAKNNKDQYFITMLDGSIMDSMKRKCFAKYANDTMGSANTLFKNNAKIGLDEQENICLIATRYIKCGEEIFCGYGSRYWHRHSVVSGVST